MKALVAVEAGVTPDGLPVFVTTPQLLLAASMVGGNAEGRALAATRIERDRARRRRRKATRVQ